MFVNNSRVCFFFFKFWESGYVLFWSIKNVVGGILVVRSLYFENKG